MNNQKLKITLILSFLLKALICFSCECVEFETESKSILEYEIDQNDWIGLGRIVHVNEEVYPLQFNIEVRTKYKGSNKVEIIQTGKSGMDCGFKFEIGEEYIIYRFQIDSLIVRTTSCHRTNKVVDSPDVEYLNRRFGQTNEHLEWNKSIVNFIEKKIGAELNIDNPPIIFDLDYKEISIRDLIGKHPNYYNLKKYDFGSGDLKRMKPKLRELAKTRDILIVEHVFQKVNRSRMIRKLNKFF